MKKLLFMFIITSLFTILVGCSENKDILGKDALSQPEEDYLVYFYQPQCSYCQEFAPTVEKYMEQENALKLYTVNLAQPYEKDTWQIYHVQGTPTLIRVQNKDGEKQEVNRWLGVQPLESLPTK